MKTFGASQTWLLPFSTEAMPVGAGDPDKFRRVGSPRPGHADLAGCLKYNFPEARYVLERRYGQRTTIVRASSLGGVTLAEHDVIVNCVLQDTDAPLLFIANYEIPVIVGGCASYSTAQDLPRPSSVRK